MSQTSRPIGLAELTPSLYTALGPRRRRQTEKIYLRLVAASAVGGGIGTAKRAYTNAALVHIFIGNLFGLFGTVLLVAYGDSVALVASWPFLILGLILITTCVIEWVTGLWQAVQVSRYFRSLP